MTVKFKHDKDMKLFFLLHPLLQMILTDASFWAYNRGIDFVLTETVTTEAQDRKLGRVSKSHSEKRAADVRSRDWSKKDREDFQYYLTSKYGINGALSHSGKIRLVIFHDSGHGQHFHVQLHSKFKL